MDSSDEEMPQNHEYVVPIHPDNNVAVQDPAEADDVNNYNDEPMTDSEDGVSEGEAIPADSDNEPIVDSEDADSEDADSENEAVPDSEDANSENESVADSEDADSENESVSDSDEPASDNEPIADSEDADSADEILPADSDDDSEDGLDDVQQFYDDFQETFSLNAEAVGYNHALIATEAHNFRAVEQFILIVAKTLRFKESYKSMITSFKIANLGFTNANFPTDMRLFWEIVNRKINNFTNILVCTICWDRLGNTKKPTMNCRCGRCGPRQKNDDLGTFLYINLRSQIQGLFRKPGIAADFEYPYTRRKSRPNAIEDVYDGNEYVRHSQEGGFLERGNHNYSLALWADGVSPARTSNVQVLPVFVQILELSPRARQRNSLLAAIYVGPRKPNMAQFLRDVAYDLNNLHNDGVTWQRNEVEITSRFITLLVSADCEERYRIFGMTRHNGAFGCTFCYANGVPRPQNERGPLIYPFDDGNAPDRTDADIRHDARQAAANERAERGVKVVSAMSIVTDFDLRAGQLVEAMHCLWEGNFVRLFNNLTNATRQHHLTAAQLAIISERITSIRTPTKLSRLPRDLKNFSNYTATEYRNTCWYYWLPCTQDLLDPQYHNLCAIFAEATFILNQDSILANEIDRAERFLQQYRQDYEALFPETELSYNLHLLKHNPRSIRDLGPSWVASGFWFESLNRQVKNYLTSPTDRASQVACRMLLAQMVEKFLDADRPLLSPETSNLVREMIGKERWENPPENPSGRYVRNDDDGLISIFADEEIAALEAAGFNNIQRDYVVISHNNTKIDGVSYQTLNNRITKYDNSIACVRTRHLGRGYQFVRILRIVDWQHHGERQGLFGTVFNILGPAFGTTYMKVVEASENVVYVPLENVLYPAVLVTACGRTYISRLPNRWDND